MHAQAKILKLLSAQTSYTASLHTMQPVIHPSNQRLSHSTLRLSRLLLPLRHGISLPFLAQRFRVLRIDFEEVVEDDE